MSTSLVNKERFIPSRLSNLAVWLDGGDSGTITLSGSTSQVTRWRDKSSNSNIFSVQPVPPPQVPPIDTVTQTNPGTYTYITSTLYSSTVAISLSGAGGGAAAAAGGKGGGALYTFSNVPPSTLINYLVGKVGTPGNRPGGGGDATTLSIGSNTIVAGGGGSGIKLVDGNAATLPFGGAAFTEGDAGFYYSSDNTTVQSVPGFTHRVGGGAGVSTNGSIVVSPPSSNFTSVGSGSFNIAVTIYNAVVTVNGAGGGGEFGGYGGNVVYTGTMPSGTYTWYVGNTGNGYLGGSGYRAGSNGPTVNGATGPFGGAPNAGGDGGFVYSSGRVTQSNMTHTVGGGSAVGSNGTIRIDVPIAPPVADNTPSTSPTTWTSPDYPSIVTIVLVGGGGGGGSSGIGSGGNGGGSGGKVTLVLTGVDPGTVFTYTVASGGGGSQDLGSPTPPDPKGLLLDIPKDAGVQKLGDVNPQDNIVGGTPGVPAGGSSTGNGAGGGGYSTVSYMDPNLRTVVTLVAGGGGGGAGYPYFSGGLQVDGGSGGDGGQTRNSQVGGLGGTLDKFGVTAGMGEDGTFGWDNGIEGVVWDPVLKSGENTNGGTAGPIIDGNNSGGPGGNGSITFSAKGSGNTAYITGPDAVFVPTETSTYILTVNGAGGGGGAGGRAVFTTTLEEKMPYPCINGVGGRGGFAGGESRVENLMVNSETASLVAGGGGGAGTNGDGGGGSSALVFPSGDKLVGGGGGGDNGGGRGGGSDNAGTNGGVSDGGDGSGFASSSLLSYTTTGFGARNGSPGSMSIVYPPTNVVVPGSGSFTAPVSGDYTITANGAGGGKAGGQGVYTTNITGGTSFSYSVGAGGTGAIPGGATFMSPFTLPGGSAVLKAGGGGGSNNIQSPGSAGESAYGGAGGQPGVSGGVGFPGKGGSPTPGVISIEGGGSSGAGAVYFTVSYTAPTVSPSLTTYTNPGVLFPSGYMAVSSNLPGLGSAKTLIAVYQCSGAAASMNIGLGTSVSGGSFGVCQTGGTLYSPYQYGYGDLTFTPDVYTARSYAFASYDTTVYTMTGMTGFDDTTMKAAAFENLVADSSLIIGRQLVGYPSEDFILYELVATSNALSASDRQEVEAYLAAKWGLTLPNRHPYKDFQPSGDQWIPIDLPNTVPGLASWLDMTIPGQTGTNIADSVGGSFRLVGQPLSLSNINNRPSLYFPGNNSAYISRASSYPTAGSSLFVFTISDTRANLPVIAFNGNPVLTYTYPTLTIQNSDNTGNSASVNLSSKYNVVFFAWDNFNYYMSVNGGNPVIGSPANLATSTTLYIGGSPGISNIPTMNLGELVVYSQYFEQAERQLLEGYLAWKWNIEANLPATHPYALESPIGATVSEVSPLNIPAQIPSLVGWLDAADAATIVLSASNVSSWYDKSATSDVFTQSGIYSPPTYATTPGSTGPSLPGVYFSGLSSLNGKLPANIASGTGSCFLVATVVGNAQVVMGGYQNGKPQNGDSFGFYIQGGKVRCPIQGAADQYMNTLGNINLGSPYVLFAQMDSGLKSGLGSFQFSTPENKGTNDIYWQASVPSSTPWGLGTTAGLNTLPQTFYIHEFLCFSEYFTDNQRQLVEGYLAWKWGLQSQLPRGHPYGNARPQSA